MWFHSVLDYLKSGSAPSRAGWARRVQRRTPLRRSRSYRPCLETLEDRCLLSDFRLGHLVQVSRGDPFAGSTADDIEHQPGILYPSTEVEPRLAVDPTDANHLVGVFMQDQWSNGNARGSMAAVSFDGGRHWRELVIPGLSLCSGGDFHRAGDPSLSFAPNGDLYMSVLPVDKGASGLNVRTGVLATKSTDGGLTWTAPVTIDLQFPAETGRQGDDFPVITADRTDPQIGYVVWSVDRETEMFSRTTDGGRTWEPGRILYDPGPGPTLFANPIVVQPDGTLINFLHVTNPGADPELLLLRSSDRGQTWTSQAIRLARQQYVPVTDPDTGQPVRDGFPGTASDVVGDPSNGNLYAVWQDGRFNGRQYDAIAFSMSTDGGLTWSEPIQINQTPTDIDPGNQQAFLPTIQVTADGTVGVTYYDFRFNDPQPRLATDYWFVHARPDDPGGLTNPANWAHELRLTNRSFDLERAPNVRGPQPGLSLFVGDYQGLAAAGNSFLAFFAMPHRQDPANIFFRRIISTLTVTSVADSGDGSLRAVIAAAQSGDKIVFDESLQGQTITLTSGELAITKNLDIEGLGADRLAISGNNASRVFGISSGVTVTIAGLMITNGRVVGGNGGGIWNVGSTLTLTHDVLSANEAVGAPGGVAEGGGVFNQGGTLTVDHSTFSANVVVGGRRLSATRTNGQGGGLASDLGATLTVSHSTFRDNRAIGGAGDPGFQGGNGAGGGLWNGGGSALTVTHSTFTRNQGIGGASGAGQPGGNGNGGGLNNNGQGNGTTLATVDHSSFTDNQGIGGVGGAGASGGNGWGGGVLNVSVNAPAALILSHCTFSGNRALGGVAGADGAGGDGRGGGVLSFVTVAGAASVSLTVSHSTFLGNQAIGRNGDPGQVGGGGFGGGIGNFGANNFDANLTVTHSTFADNRATGGQGGTGAAGGNGEGGGIASSGLGVGAAGRATLDVSNSVLVDNKATGGVGGAGGNGGEGRGGGITSGMFSLSTVSYTTLADNQAVGGQGGDGGNGGNGQGGGIYVDAGNDTVSLEHDLITDNQATGGDGGDGGTDGQGVGGGLYIASGTVVAHHTRITHNHASTSDDDVFGNLG
jgi:hypothetical protein